MQKLYKAKKWYKAPLKKNLIFESPKKLENEKMMAFHCYIYIDLLHFSPKNGIWIDEQEYTDLGASSSGTFTNHGSGTILVYNCGGRLLYSL